MTPVIGDTERDDDSLEYDAVVDPGFAKRGVQEQVRGALVVEQHMNQAPRYVERVHVLGRGPVVESGAVKEIRDRSRETYIT